MKKSFLVLATLLMSVIPVGAVDWQAVETNIPNFNLYIDMDSIKSLNDKEYLYAIKYGFADNPEKVAYMKSDLDTNYIGVIRSGDFEKENYNPAPIFATPHVFMKPINDSSFLTFTHKYVADLSESGIKSADSGTVTSDIAQEQALPAKSTDKKFKNSNTKQVSYKREAHPKMTSVNMQEYVASVCSELDKNWNPPASGRKTQAIVIITVGADGSLYEYHFAKSSGDEATDRSIISALKQTVPFPKFPNMKRNVRNFNFQFVFDYGIFKKSVI